MILSLTSSDKPTPPARPRKRPFKKILIANRGEIAVRIIETCRRLNIRTVAVYSEADTNAKHVKEADEAVYIGPAPTRMSYLNIDAIIDACEQTGAEAVHPGYGFLSEKAEFAKKLAERGIALIGPSADAIRLMGDKIESKKLARKAGVNIVPGGLEAISNEKDAKRLAGKIGYPVIIKAAAGGGGKGMRVARNEAELAEGMRLAVSEATSSFGDGRVFIEKYFDNPRHIEIQVLADKYGNTIHLGERECSIQRRHQKVIEEAPSVFVDEALRTKMGKQAVQLAKQVGYYSAGTVEFIVDQDKSFYFLEMNTRLQVEHRVTELITGIDLVEQMIRIAAGEKLAIEQKDVQFRGWAMETRVYAEDPKRGFLPSIGRLINYQEPVASESIIIDSGVYEGGEVSMYYDPMISKVCTHAATRSQTIDMMKSTLSAYLIDGVSHNISFLQTVLSNARFASGDISTNFIAQEFPGGFANAALTEEMTKVFLGVGIHMYLRQLERAAQTSGQLPGRARVIGARWVVNLDGQDFPVITKSKDQGYDISYDTGLIVTRSSWTMGRGLFQGTINGKPVSVQGKVLSEGYRLIYDGAEIITKIRTPRVAELATYMPAKQERKIGNQLLAPIAGLVTSIAVEDGMVLREGQEVMVIEAMKMENVMRAEEELVVKKIHVAKGESVQADQLMIEFEPVKSE